jgi:hypothetical protein
MADHRMLNKLMACIALRNTANVMLIFLQVTKPAFRRQE